MIAELGLYALILALCFSTLQGLIPLAGSYLGSARWMRLAQPLALLNFTLLAGSFVALTLCFLNDDFSVAYVAQNSNSLLPTPYKFSAVWGAHEGSLLLWALILSLWSAIFASKSAAIPLRLRARILSILGLVAVGFLAFTLFTSNPFARILPFAPADGADLNPLLQDFGLIIHPPALYFGYVGFAIPFAFAIAQLLEPGIRQQTSLGNAWTRWVRPWVNAAWAWLTIGIALGSWWAYYELGWGGWWFWDPVENASFLPWLAGTALLHAVAAADKRQLFSSWTLLLAIFAFSLSLLGTFLVRSGVLTSVHAFAADPERGFFILMFLAVVVGSSLTLFALRAPLQASKPYRFLSREMCILINSCLISIILAVVMLGTLYPLFADALDLGKISVGPPYFNRFFIPLMAAILVVLPFGVFLQWNDQIRFAVLFQRLRMPLFSAIAVSPLLIFALGLPMDVMTLLGGALGVWVIASTLADIVGKVRNAPRFFEGLSKLRLSYWGMVLGHIGLAITWLGIVFVAQGSEQRDLRMVPGDSETLAGYTFTFKRMDAGQGPNYTFQHGVFSVQAPGGRLVILEPEKRRYVVSKQVMTEAAIWPGFTRDLYISLGEALEPEKGEMSAWSVRLHNKPAVRWLWLGAIIMSLGAILAVFDKRYRHQRIRQNPAAGSDV